MAEEVGEGIIEKVARERFGFETLLPGQREVMGHLLAGRSAAAVFPTGGGKSLCYQLPALLLDGLTLVVSPLIALMKDQIDALAARGIEARRLDSSLSAEEYRGVMERMRDGTLKLLYVAPERFNNERFRGAIRRTRLSLLAIDEAHCISEWGHNFRPDYLKLARIAREYGAERVLALTATATEQVLDDVCERFAIAPDCAIRTTFYRPNLTLLSRVVDDSGRDALLVDRLRERPRGATIVYVTLQRTAERVADELVKAGFDARAYHAGMETEARTSVQDWFMGSPDGIVVATIAFGMGVDKADIRYVYHYNAPKSLESYSQEIGRAGRDGKPSTCELFLCGDDLNVLENFAHGDTPSPESLRSFTDDIFSRAGERQTFDVSHFGLSAKHDVRNLVVRTLLTYLELEGFLESGTPFYQSYRFKPRASSAEILSRFEGERRVFLGRLLAQAQRAKTWFAIDVDAAVKALGSSRDRIVRALDYLGEQELLEIRVEGVRHRYRMLRKPDDLDAVARWLHDRALAREEGEVARLAQVVDLVCADGCQTRRLGEHFGEPLPEPCGHCSRCLSDAPAPERPKRPTVQIADAIWEGVDAARSQNARTRSALAEPRAATRFLCGISSPRLSRARLTSHPLFGALAHVPFREVLVHLEPRSASIAAGT